MKFIFILNLATYLFCSSGANGKEIALSFDDAPKEDQRIFTGRERTNLLISELKQANVKQVAFFCNTAGFDHEGTSRIQDYARAGHVIANHTHSHLDLHQSTVKAFVSEIQRADEILKDFKTYRKWFRFPYLREGETILKRDELRRYLLKTNYKNAYVTVDNYDWYMNAMVQRALKEGKKVNYDTLRKLYVRVLLESISFYDDIAQRFLHRSPKHVLLLHENDLAGLFVGDLVNALRAKNWTIISADDAYTDPIATTEPDTLLLGQGRVVAIAAASGDRGPFSIWESEETLEELFKTEGVFSN